MKSQHAATNQIRQKRKKLQPVTDHKCARLKRGETELNGNWGRFLMRTMLVLTMTSALLSPIEVHAQSMADYTAVPPFVSENAVPPNVLLLLDNSGSMNRAAYRTAFNPTKVYFGLFDPLECYSYGTNKFQPDPGANPVSPGTCVNAPYEWSGNLLNYVSMRRIDIVKWVMMGGTCSVGGRDAMGGCRQLIGQNTFSSGTCCRNFTQSVTTAQATDRMPASIMPSGSTVYFHLRGSTASLKGFFCVDDDSSQQTSSDCNDGGSYTETKWKIRVDLFENASGIIQQVLLNVLCPMSCRHLLGRWTGRAGRLPAAHRTEHV